MLSDTYATILKEELTKRSKPVGVFMIKDRTNYVTAAAGSHKFNAWLDSSPKDFMGVYNEHAEESWLADDFAYMMEQ